MIAALVSAVDEVVSCAPADLADGELAEALVALQCERARLEAVAARLAGEFDARGLHGLDGARSAKTWIAWRCRIPAAVAGGLVGAGRVLRHQPVTETAWLAGEVTGSHQRVLAQARTDTTASIFERDEAMLVDFARTLSFPDFVRAVRYWAIHADPDGAQNAADRQHAARHLHLSRSFDGAWFAALCLDPVGGSIVHTELARLTDDLYHQDDKEARARLGRRPLPSELARTPTQRRADALVEMATRSATAPARGRRPQPLVSILVGSHTLQQLCELDDGAVITPRTARRWLDDALIEAALIDGHERPSRISHKRTYTGALRRIIELRDRTCYHPTCHEPAPRCHIDHIQGFTHNGPTTETNGRLACPHHNQQRNNKAPPGDP